MNRRDPGADGKVWVTLDREDLAPGTPVRASIEKGLEGWAANHINANGRVESYEEWLVRLEGPWQDPTTGEWVYLELPGQMDGPVWTRLVIIARALAKQLR